jgi:hypothetical protein
VGLQPGEVEVVGTEVGREGEYGKLGGGHALGFVQRKSKFVKLADQVGPFDDEHTPRIGRLYS